MKNCLYDDCRSFQIELIFYTLCHMDPVIWKGLIELILNEDIKGDYFLVNQSVADINRDIKTQTCTSKYL